MTPLPRVECAGWTNGSGVRIRCGSGGVVQVGEPGGRVLEGTCRRCFELAQQAQRLRRKLDDDRARRERREGKTFGPGEGDAFEGFRD